MTKLSNADQAIADIVAMHKDESAEAVQEYVVSRINRSDLLAVFIGLQDHQSLNETNAADDAIAVIRPILFAPR